MEVKTIKFSLFKEFNTKQNACLQNDAFFILSNRYSKIQELFNENSTFKLTIIKEKLTNKR